jgi:site-specific recombinase XerD
MEYLANVNKAVAGSVLSPTTARTYKSDIQDFENLTDAEAPLDELTADDVDSIVLAYAQKPDRRRSSPSGVKSSGTTARFRQSVNRLFSFAEKKGYVQYNPMPDTTIKPRVKRQSDGIRTALPLDSARALAQVPRDYKVPRKDQDLRVRDEVIIRIILETGPRVSELCAFDMSDLEYRENAVWLKIRFGKGGKPRDVPLSASTAELLNLYRTRDRLTVGGQENQTAMFLTYRGNRVSPRDVQNLVKKSCMLLPLNVRRAATPHALRHTMATLALASGSADVSVIQKLLGHASLATTGIYLDEIREELVHAVAHNPITEDL